MLASTIGQNEMIEYLLHLGAELDIKDFSYGRN